MFELGTKILLAEDIDITRTIVKKMLEKMGFKNVTDVPNGLIAWEEIQKSIKLIPYQLVLANWNMPEINGIELLNKIQALPRMRSTPFLLFTSNIEKDQVVHAIQQGVSIYLSKPFAAAALEQKLKEAWDRFCGRKFPAYPVAT